MTTVCSLCHGCGLDQDRTKDTVPGKYDDDLLCERCGGSGTEPEGMIKGTLVLPTQGEIEYRKRQR